MAFVEVRELQKIYPARPAPVVALERADLAMEEGEIVALLGPSGCGKTTMLRIVAGLTDATSGSVRVGGREVSGPFPDYGFVFQQPSLMPWRTVRDNVLFPMEILGRLDRAAKERAEHLLELTGLGGFAEALPRQLSGGMQQRVSLCRGLIHQPKLLLMDEPFGALDELTRLEMNEMMLRVRKDTGAAVLFVTHSISEAIFMSDQVVVFSRRPARVCENFRVSLPEPRSQSSRFLPEFLAAERRASVALGFIPASEGASA